MLSRYKILERIGTGGIGFVHRAEDLTLKRMVAVKFLSEESFKKAHTRARFQREARLAASLNHPNICTVHEVGEAAPGDEMVLGGNPTVQPGTPFIVLEFVDGQPLDEVIKEGGPMPLQKLLEIAIQVSDGLAEAHAHSIVHRDLKPKNVMLTSRGRAKILDFGMAKPLHPAQHDDDLMKTTQAYSVELTREGMVLGTVAYMSPEQACGKVVDARSDVFSLGVMIYEMAAGRRPFEGDSLTSTLAKILETEPSSITDSRKDIPPEFSRIINRCLRKKKEDRYNDTRDLTVALKDLLHETSSGMVRKARAVSGGSLLASAPKRRRTAVWAVAGAAVILAAVALAWLVPKLIGRSARFVPPSFEQLTFTGSATHPALSPDGHSLAYVTRRPGGNSQVVIQDLAGAQQLPIFEARGIRSLRWSPNGSELLVSGSSIDNVSQTFLVSRLGGATRQLRYLPFVAWAPDGKRFAGTTLSAREIWLIDPLAGSTSSIELTGEFAFIYEIDWSPTGALLAFRTSDESERHAIWTITVDGSKQQQVVQEAGALYSPRFSPAGDAIYYLSGTEHARELRKIEIDAESGEPEDESVLLLSGLQAGDHMDFSGDGKRLLYARSVSHTNLWLVDRQGASGAVTTQQLTHGTFRNETPRFSPDGTRVAMTRRSRSNPNVFVMSLADRQPAQLTFLTADIWQPVWSPDGNEIAFGTTMGGAPRVWKVDVRGGTPEPFNNSSLSRDLAWAPGSKLVYQRPGNSAFHFLDPNGGDETAFMDDAGGGSADPLQFFSYMASPEYSPDGKQVAINCNCPGGEGIWIVSVKDSSSKLIHNDSGAFPLGWSADGAWVYALKRATGNVMRIPTGGGKVESLLDIPFERVGDIDISPDGTQIVAAVPVTQADIWLIENFDPHLN